MVIRCLWSIKISKHIIVLPKLEFSRNIVPHNEAKSSSFQVSHLIIVPKLNHLFPPRQLSPSLNFKPYLAGWNNSSIEKSRGFSFPRRRTIIAKVSSQVLNLWNRNAISPRSADSSSQGRPFQGFLEGKFHGAGFPIDVSDKLTTWFSVETWAVGLSLIAPFHPPLFGNWRGTLGQGRV